MLHVLMILVPVVLLSVFLAGGLPSQFPQRVVFPSAGLPSQVVIPTPSPGKQLQIRPFRVALPSGEPACENKKIAVNMLLDTSGSMGEPISKLNSLKAAVIGFVNFLNEDDIIGVQEFSSPPINTGPPLRCGSTSAACEVIPIGNFTNKTDFINKINQLEPHSATNMRTAFGFSKNVLIPRLSNYSNEEYNWVYIFFSDGEPVPDNQTPLSPTDVTQEIKDRMRLITVGLGGANERIMRGVASPETAEQTNYYYAPDGSRLEAIFRSIAGDLCPT